MITVMLILVLVGFALTVANAIGKAPLWMAVVLVYVVLLILVLPPHLVPLR